MEQSILWPGLRSGVIYDASGDVLSYNDATMGAMSYTYDAESQAASVSVGGTLAAKYVYDASGAPAAKLTSTDAVTANYVLGPGGVYAELDASDNIVHRGLYAGSALAASYDRSGDLHLQLSDWLGTRRAQTDAVGVLQMTYASYPFGDGLTPIAVAGYSGDDSNEKHFTGKERDTETGLDYFGARYYGSNMGRFLSPDPLGIGSGSLANPQSLNLYSYVLNNPLLFTDPDGRECVWDDGTYDSNDDPDTGSSEKCSGQGGTWIGHDVFANSSYYAGDWVGDPNAAGNDARAGLVGDIQSCSAAVGGGQGASLLIANAFASGFSNDMTAYTLASAAWESGPGGIGTNMTEVGSPSYFNKYNGILGNKSNADAFACRGRGYVQITGKSNYQHWSNELGVDLVANPNLAAMPDVAAQIAVEGLDKGTFTGVSLYNYVNPGGTDFVNARRTINGTDSAKAIAASANSFSQSLSGCR